MAEVYENKGVSGSRRVRSASVSQSFGSSTQLAVEAYGAGKPESLTLALVHNGATVESEAFTFEGKERTGGVDLRTGEYTGTRSQEPDLGVFQEASGDYLAKPRYNSTLDDAYPAQPFTPDPRSTEDKARSALEANGYNLVIYDGPGIWRKGGDEQERSGGTVDILGYLQSTLLATGARYWIDGDTVYIDGRKIPTLFNLPPSDAHLITGYSWAEEIIGEPRPEGEDPDEEEEPPTEEELGLDPEPEEDDYLSQCPDYSGTPPGYEPPEVTPEEPVSGPFEYAMAVGEDDERTVVTHKNIYEAGIRVRTEASESGVVSKPGGKEFTERTRVVTVFQYHPNCPQALLRQTDTVYTVPDMNDLPGSSNETDVELARDLYAALVRKAEENGVDGLYLQSSRVETNVYHAEGWLSRQIEVNKELNVLSYRAKENPEDELELNISYNTRTRTLVWEPQMNGQWASYTLERQTENVVVYETAAGQNGEPDTAAPSTVQRVARVTPRVEGGDQAPPQINCPPPEPVLPDTGYFWSFGDGPEVPGRPNESHTYAAEGVYSVQVRFVHPVTEEEYTASGQAATGNTGQPSSGSSGTLNLSVVSAPGLNNRQFYFYTSRTVSCIEQKQEEYQKDLQKWEDEREEALERYESERATPENISKRVHSIQFGVLRPDFKLNDLYGNGLVASVSHSYSDDGTTVSGTTSIQVWQRI